MIVYRKWKERIKRKIYWQKATKKNKNAINTYLIDSMYQEKTMVETDKSKSIKSHELLKLK